MADAILKRLSARRIIECKDEAAARAAVRQLVLDNLALEERVDADARKLLLEYVGDANALSTTPEFYNSITTNCTTTILKMMRAVGGKLPFDWRLIVNGYLP